MLCVTRPTLITAVRRCTHGPPGTLTGEFRWAMKQVKILKRLFSVFDFVSIPYQYTKAATSVMCVTCEPPIVTLFRTVVRTCAVYKSLIFLVLASYSDWDHAHLTKSHVLYREPRSKRSSTMKSTPVDLMRG